MNYYLHHLGDYDGATAHLSWLEDCAYRRLLCHYYRNEKPFPSDTNQVFRLVRASSKSERLAVQAVLKEFFNLADDGWHHKRCDEEIARYQEKQAKARRSADARWTNKQTQCGGNANASADAMRTHSEGNATRARPNSQEPITNSQEPNTAAGGSSDTRPQSSSDESPRAAGNGQRGTPMVLGWTPRPQTIEALVSPISGNVPTQFVQEQIPQFVDYWFDRGERAESWDGRFRKQVIDHWRETGHAWRAAPLPSEVGNAFDRTNDRSWAAGFLDQHTDPSWRAGSTALDLPNSPSSLQETTPLPR